MKEGCTWNLGRRHETHSVVHLLVFIWRQKVNTQNKIGIEVEKGIERNQKH